MVPLSLLTEIHTQQAVLAGIGGTAAAVLYGWSAARRRHAVQERLARVRRLLEPLCLLSGLLGTLPDPLPSGSAEERRLLRLASLCRSAPGLSHHLLDHLEAFVRDLPVQRPPLSLRRALETEIESLRDEQNRLVRSLDKPGWAQGFWLLIRPAVSVALAAAVILVTLQLYTVLDSRQTPGIPAAYYWMRWASLLVTVLSFYRLVMENSRSLTPFRRVLCLLMAASAILHVFGETLSPYVLAIQLVLFGSGFAFGPGKSSRRKRPYAGSDEPGEG